MIIRTTTTTTIIIIIIIMVIIIILSIIITIITRRFESPYTLEKAHNALESTTCNRNKIKQDKLLK